MIPKYTFALGGTDAIKKIFTFLDSQKDTITEINRKQTENKYEI